MSLLLRVWRGEYSLGRQFWLAHVAVCIGYLLLVRYLLLNLGAQFTNALTSNWLPLAVGGGLFLLMIWSLTGLWRAAGRHELWPRMLARSWVVVASGLAYAVFVVPWIAGIFR